jgi:uncharacterized protein
MRLMMYYPRIIKKKIEKTLASKSVLLLGPRQTGKSSLIREELAPDRIFNLLDQSTFLQFSRRLSSLRESLRPEDKLIVIDEIQKLPQLMDEVHLMIEEQQKRFLLTGSSARKLRRSYTRLMGGRTRSVYMHPLVASELGKDFNLARALSYGCLPPVWLSPDPFSELVDYVGDYLQQEILAEAVTRGVDQYSRFLTQIATCATQTLNIDSLSRDAQLAPSTTRRYLEILADTMVATQIDPWKAGKKRKAISSTKLLFFDVGVVNALLEIDGYNSRSNDAGWQFEQFVGQELVSYSEYSDRNIKLNFWRSTEKHEVDFILGDSIAIEVKHTSLVTEKDLKGLVAISEEGKWRHKIVVSRDSIPRRIGDIDILPVEEFLQRLWNNELNL